MKINVPLNGCRLSQSCTMAFDHLPQRLPCSAKPYRIRRFTLEARNQIALALYAFLLRSKQLS
jgi:hypothetical protein